MKFRPGKAIFFTQWEVWLWISFFFFLLFFSWLSLLSVYIPGEFSLAVWVMWVLITAWSAYCDFFITIWIMPTIDRVILAILRNNLHWSRSCNVWNVEWPSSVSHSHGVGGYHGSSLLRLSWSTRRTDFEMMNTLGTVNSLGTREWSRECSGCCSSENRLDGFLCEWL